jgi:small subunit ribosomal protein S2
MSESKIKIRDMLIAGVHFGHKTSRWNPKMRQYIFGSRNGIHIIDLQKTARMFRQAYRLIRDTVMQGQHVLFVGTKRHAQEVMRKEAERCGQFYVNHRWLGGTMTNFSTIKQSIERLNKLEQQFEDGSIQSLPKKEILGLEKQCAKLKSNLGGIQQMGGLPGLIFVIDIFKERIAVNEANKLKIPVVAIVDTNCDPQNIDYPIPGNDDAIRSIELISEIIADACAEGMSMRKELPQEESKAPAAKTQSRFAKDTTGRPPVEFRYHAATEETEEITDPKTKDM